MLAVLTSAAIAGCANPPCRIDDLPTNVALHLQEIAAVSPEAPTCRTRRLRASAETDHRSPGEAVESDPIQVNRHEQGLLEALLWAARQRALFAEADVATLARWFSVPDDEFILANDRRSALLAEVQRRDPVARREFAEIARRGSWWHEGMEREFEWAAAIAPEHFHLIAPGHIALVPGENCPVTVTVTNKTVQTIAVTPHARSDCGRNGSVWLDVFDEAGHRRCRRICADVGDDLTFRHRPDGKDLPPGGRIDQSFDLTDYVFELEPGEYSIRFCVALEGYSIDHPVMPLVVPVIWSTSSSLTVTAPRSRDGSGEE